MLLKALALVSLALFSYSEEDFLPVKLNSYSENEAKLYAFASSLSYCKVDSIKSFSCGDICNHLTGYQPLVVWRSNAGFQSVTYALIYNSNSQTLIISFEGTNNFIQLVSEIATSVGVSYDLHDIGNAQVMKYFYSNYKSYIRTQFLTDFQKVLGSHSIQMIVFTGHSLGGAIAEHAVADCLFSNIIDQSRYNIKVYTYGAPRVGDYVWCQAVYGKVSAHYRVVHHYDTVPHLPPCNPLLQGLESSGCKKSGSSFIYYPYHLPIEEWYVENFSSHKECSSTEGEDQSCSNSVLIGYNVPDHLIYFGIDLGDCKLA